MRPAIVFLILALSLMGHDQRASSQGQGRPSEDYWNMTREEYCAKVGNGCPQEPADRSSADSSSGTYDPSAGFRRTEELVNDMFEQSRRESEARRAAERARNAEERSSGLGPRPELFSQCGEPTLPVSQYKSLHADWWQMAGDAGYSMDVACDKGRSTCQARREQHERILIQAAEFSCLLAKAEAREADEAELATFSKYWNPSSNVLLTADSPLERVNVDGVSARQLDLAFWRPDCAKIDVNHMVNSCEQDVNIAWFATDGPCRGDASQVPPCGTRARAGSRFQLLPEGRGITGQVFWCLAPAIPTFVTKDRWSCSVWQQTDVQNAKASVNGTNREWASRPQYGEDRGNDSNGDTAKVRTQLGNKAILASEAGLSRLVSRSAISEYGFDKDLLANDCVKSFYHTYESGAKASRLTNTCNRKINVSWFDSDGPCKERNPENWTCAEWIGAGQTAGTVKLPEGSRREYGACFDPGLPVRQGGGYACAAWKHMGGSDYLPGKLMEWVERD